MLQTTERVQGNDGDMNLPTLTISAQNGWMDQRDRFSKNIAGKEQKNYTQLSYGELSYNKGNSKYAPFGVVYMLGSHSKALVPRVYHSFKVIEGNPKFYEKMFETSKPNKELGKLITSGARMDGLLNINYQDFSEISITVPKTKEQNQIVEFLGSLEKLITLYQRKVEALKDLKYIYLINMLSDKMWNPILRFSYYNNNWKTYLLGDIGKVYSGIGFPEKEQGGKSGIPFYKISDMNTKGNETELFHSNNYVTNVQVDRNKWKIFEKNIAIMFAKVGAAIMLNRKRIVKPPFLIDNNSMIYSLNDNWDYRFAKSLFETLYLPMYSQVGALPSYNASEINRIKVCIPDVHEQKDIGNALFLLEKMNEFNQLRLMKILNLKKSYLNCLFV